MRGEFGERSAPHPDRDQPAWCHLLATIYWAFDLDAVADRLLYGEWLTDSVSVQDVTLRIRGFRKSLKSIGGPKDIPL